MAMVKRRRRNAPYRVGGWVTAWLKRHGHTWRPSGPGGGCVMCDPSAHGPVLHACYRCAEAISRRYGQPGTAIMASTVMTMRARMLGATEEAA